MLPFVTAAHPDQVPSGTGVFPDRVARLTVVLLAWLPVQFSVSHGTVAPASNTRDTKVPDPA